MGQAETGIGSEIFPIMVTFLGAIHAVGPKTGFLLE